MSDVMNKWHIYSIQDYDNNHAVSLKFFFDSWNALWADINDLRSLSMVVSYHIDMLCCWFGYRYQWQIRCLLG